tara:strand:+ start:35452 stop:42342 length:6891 start_codon:yes stop_codon:yes gene_type:complete
MKSPNLLIGYPYSLRYIVLLLFLLPNFISFAQQKAFPSAYGGGAFASGGRGGYVYHVTSLLDDNSEGTFRWALAQPRPSTIVFDVSGIIDLTSWLTLGGSDVTIAGQSAPVGGITITSSTYQRFRGQDINNFIVRYLRLRPRQSGDDAFEFYGNSAGASNIIMDHLSVSYGGDECISLRGQGTHNVTYQRLLVAEAKTGSLFGDSATPGNSYDNSYLNSLFYNISHRTPNVATNGRVDIINNVTHNWQYRLSMVEGNTKLNHINNYYSLGSRNSLTGGGSQIQLNPLVSSYNNQIYTAGNIADKGAFTDPNANNEVLWVEFSSGAQTSYAPSSEFVSSPYTQVGVPMVIKSATDAYNDVISDVGANASLNADGTVTYYTDINDTDYLNIMSQGEGAFEAYEMYGSVRSWFSEQRYIDFVNSINSNVINSRPDNFYVSNPHIPETWFIANVPEGEDHNDIAPSGYTWLEEYLNSVDAPEVIIALENLEVTPSTSEIELSETLQLEVAFTPSNATYISGEWSSSDESIATVDENGEVSPVSVGNVIITFTTSDGEFLDSAEITVFPEALEASAGIDQQICEGESTTLEATGGTSYLWNTGETTAIIETTPEATSTYSVVVSDEYGQSEEVSVTVTVNENPLAFAGEDRTICIGESITLTATGGISYLWSTGETTESIVVSPLEDTTYTVDVSNDSCSSSDEVIVFVNELPEISVTEDLVIVEGESTILTATGNNNYLWNTGETTEFISVNPTVTTTYSVTTDGEENCSNTAFVTVTVIPEVIANAGEDVTICNGEVVTLTASGGSNYLWNTGDTVPEVIVNPNETTTYLITVEDDYGYSDTDEVTVFVNEVPEIIVTEDVVIVEGDSVTLSVSGSDNYEWSTGETENSITVFPLVTTTYSVSTLGANGCSSTVNVTVTVVPEIVAFVGEDITICQGETITLNASGGYTYTWNTGDEGEEIMVSPNETTVYTVTAEDEYGFTDTDDITIFVNESPNLSVSDNIYVMIGDSATLVVSGADFYLWDTGETTNEITVTPDITTTYTVVGEGLNGCQTTSEVIVTVVEVLNANAGEDISICQGDTVTLNASGGVSYTWDSGETVATPSFTPTETTTYTVTVADGYGHTDTDDVTVTVIPVPIANAGEDQITCQGEPVTLSATAEGGDVFLWSTGETTPTITVNPLEDAVYTVEVSNSLCSHADEVSVFVLPIAELSISEDIVIITGNSTTLEVSGGESYLWSTGDTSGTIVVNPTETTTYSVINFSGNGCESTAEVTVSVIPQVVAYAGEDISICEEESITLNASGGGSYLWSTGETSASITVTPSETTIYTVTVSDSYGFSDSDDLIVTVNDLPNILVSEDIVIFEEESTNLTVSGADTYLWSNGETTASIVVSPIQTTTYSVIGYTFSGCQVIEEITVTVIPVVNAFAGNDIEICSGESITLIATGGSNYEWSNGEMNDTITISPTETTTYIVNVSDNYGNSDSDSVTVTVNDSPILTISENILIIEGESAILNVDGADSYLWSTGETLNSITVNPVETTIYNVTGYSENGCVITEEVTVTVIPQVIADAGSDTNICLGDSITLNASGGANFLWNTGENNSSITVSPIETTSYTVTVSDNYGNFDSDTVTIVVNESPTITTSENITILVGESTSLTANGAESYLWSTGEISNIISVSPSETTIYGVTAYSINNCEVYREITVEVIPNVIADAGNDVVICEGESVTLNASGSIYYTWSTGEIENPITVTPSETTTYVVEVSDEYGTSAIDSVTVFVNELPNIDVVGNLTIFEGESTSLNVSGAESYLWSTLETSNTIEVSPIVTTTYTVTGYSSNNCEVTEEITVIVLPEFTVNAGSDLTICSGESITLTATDSASYLWNTGETTASITISPLETTTYNVTATDTYGNSDSDSVTVMVNDLPTINVSENVTILEGESINLSVDGALTYLWSTGESSNTITVGPTETTTYTVIGSTNSCDSLQEEVTVTVIPLFVASAGVDEHICDNLSYEVVLSANQGDSYLWSTGETSQSIIVNPLSSTTYSVTITQGEQIDSDSVTVYVEPSPEVVIENGESVDIMNGDFITLSASGANTFEWNNGATQPNIAVSPSITTTYEVRGYVGDCYDEKAVTVNVLNPVIADAGEDVIICPEELVSLTATGGDDYVWSTGQTTETIQVSPSETTDYTVTVFNALDFDEATVRVEVDLDCTTQSDLPTNADEIDLDVYPNPALNEVNIKLTGVFEVSYIHIFDVTGKLVSKIQIFNDELNPTTTTTINISSLQSGIYFVKFLDETRDITKKLIVN